MDRAGAVQDGLAAEGVVALFDAGAFEKAAIEAGARTSYTAPMTQASLTRGIKRALAQGLRDNRDAVRDLLAEVLEDVAMAHAIEHGRKTKPVRRAAVIKALARRR